jgi:2Fe-2S ferredoxin
MVEIVVIDRSGVAHAISAPPASSLMAVLRDGGFDIEAACGGNCVCATCHVYVQEARLPGGLSSPEDDESELLGQLAYATPASRLACQLPFDSGMDAFVFRLAPEE